jgi:hypothetical protein
MHLAPAAAEAYARSLIRLRPTIKNVADVFAKLASPSEEILSPRYNLRASKDGARLHPRMIARIPLQQATGQEQAIWQPVSRQAKRQEVSFGGLDVHLLVDVSGSMQGGNARSAADTALCLTEGLQLARYRISRQNGAYHQPDVRTQITAFGSDSVILSQLSYQPSAPDKGRMFTNLRNPTSGSTLINQSLQQIRAIATGSPGRDQLAIIISDGQFHDFSEARQSSSNMPESVYTAQLVVGQELDAFISANHDNVTDNKTLPGKLYNVLRAYIRRYN